MLCKRSNGFSLIELLVVVAIVAILAAIAFPSFEGSMRSNRVATTTNEMMASLSLARSEAIRSSRRSVVCASTDGSGCNGTSWNDGWVVMTDNDAVPGDMETVVRVVQAHQDMAMAGSAPVAIEFDRRGRPLAAAVGTVTLQPDTCPTGQQLIRTLSINASGQLRIAKGGCS